jgi:YD repeat-containing protein
VTYTPHGELASAITEDGGTSLLDLAFSYDILGRIVTKTDTGVVWSYGYDLAGRLATVKKDGAPSATYTLDANGNRLTDDAAHDEEDRQLTGGATFTYTPNGERKTRVEAGGTTSHGYDGRGHLTSVVLPNGKKLVYGVDASGRRVSRSEDGVVTHRWLHRNRLQPGAGVCQPGSRRHQRAQIGLPDFPDDGAIDREGSGAAGRSCPRDTGSSQGRWMKRPGRRRWHSSSSSCWSRLPRFWEPSRPAMRASSASASRACSESLARRSAASICSSHAPRPGRRPGNSNAPVALPGR